MLAINKNSSVRNFVFQVHTSSPLHWYLHWRRSKTQEWWVELQQHKKIIRMYKCTTENERFLLFSLQITVSSGGMLTQKLDVDDLQFEKGTFDGTMAYAQNKVEWLTERCRDLQRNCCGIYIDMHFCLSLTEAAGDPDRKMGCSAQRDPLLQHAPWLGRHTRWRKERIL